MDWMYWTTPTAILFGILGLTLAGMTWLELRYPCVARKGFLPMRTTRGDRLFLGLLCMAVLNLAWTGLTDLSQWGGVALSLLALATILRRG